MHLIGFAKPTRAAAGARGTWAEICSVVQKGFPLSPLSPTSVLRSSWSPLDGANAFSKDFTPLIHKHTRVINISSVDLKR